MAKKRSIASLARRAVVNSMFIKAQSEAASIGNQQVVNMVTALGVLDEPTGDQVDQVLGLVDGVLDLESRYKALVKTEREAVAGGPEEDGDEVDSGKAREQLPNQATQQLIRTRAWLSAASTLLHSLDRPLANKDLVPVPGQGMGGGQSPSQGRGAPRQE